MVRSWQLQQTSGESVIGNGVVISVQCVSFRNPRIQFHGCLFLCETITKKVAGARCCQPELLESPALGKAS
jgi:hypothetical protein